MRQHADGRCDQTRRRGHDQDYGQCSSGKENSVTDARFRASIGTEGAQCILELKVNGANYAVDADADRALLGVLRDDLGLTGAKYGCGEGQCGACMVLVDDQPLPACITPVGAAVGRELVTVEGLAVGGCLHPLQQAFLDQEAFQCGFCTPGMLVSGVGLLRRNATPSTAAIVSALQPNICRCGTYQRIVCAVQQAARVMSAPAKGANAE